MDKKWDHKSRILIVIMNDIVVVKKRSHDDNSIQNHRMTKI